MDKLKNLEKSNKEATKQIEDLNKEKNNLSDLVKNLKLDNEKIVETMQKAKEQQIEELK